MKYQAIVLAAGSGKRSGLDYNKIFYKIDDKLIIEKSVYLFLDDPECTKVVVVANKTDCTELTKLFDNKVSVCVGGATRQESVKNGLSLIDGEYVFIHDGARPYASVKLVCRIKEALKEHDCVIPVISLKDSIKIVKDNVVVKSVNREDYKLIQTPQAFISEKIKLAHNLAVNNDYTDDAAMIEEILNESIYCVKGETQNIKMTYKEDF